MEIVRVVVRMNEDEMARYTLEDCMSCPKLPSLPAVAMRVLELTKDENVDFNALAQTIENDQALASKILRTVNSSYYGLARRCASIKQAMVYLGINAVKTLALGFSLAESIDGGEDEVVTFDYLTYWRRGLYAAVGARFIAEQHHRCDPDEAFLAGLVQDLGMVGMYRVIGDEYLVAIDLTNGDHRTLPTIEQRSFEICHTVVGAAIGETWKLPDNILSCMRHGHHPDDAEAEHAPIVRTVALANAVTHVLMVPDSESTLRWIATHAKGWFEMDAAATKSLLSTIRTLTDELAPLFNIRTNNEIVNDELVATAEDQLVRMHMDLERENDELHAHITEMAREGVLDRQSGVAVRSHLDAELERLFADALATDGQLSLVLADIDEFTKLNDTQGHLVGDMLIREVARRIQSFVGVRGLVGRFDGACFAIVLPGFDRTVASRLAEQLRQDIEAKPPQLKDSDRVGKSVSIGLSLGVATVDPSVRARLNAPNLLVRVAELAVKAAKQSGRNCVRVFQMSEHAKVA